MVPCHQPNFSERPSAPAAMATAIFWLETSLAEDPVCQLRKIDLCRDPTYKGSFVGTLTLCSR